MESKDNERDNKSAAVDKEWKDDHGRTPWGMENMPAVFSPHLERIPASDVQPKSIKGLACNPGKFARLLLQAHEGRHDKVEMAAKVARRVMELLEHELENPSVNNFVDACATGQIKYVKSCIANRDIALDGRHSILGYGGLHAASDFGHLRIVKLLIENGADVHLERKSDLALPLHCAAEHGRLEIVEYLVFRGGADKSRKNKHGSRAFDLARAENHRKVMDVLQEPPFPVEAVRVQGLTHCSAVLLWETPDDNGVAIEEYEISVLPVNGVEIKLNPENGQAPRVVVVEAMGDRETYCFEEQALTPATEYKVSIRARNPAGWSESGNDVRFKTLQYIPEAPSMASLSTIGGATCTSIDLEWSAPLNNNGAIIEAYQMQTREHGKEGGWFTVAEDIPGKVSSVNANNYREETQIDVVRYTMEGLENARTYVFRIRARNCAGWGPWNETSNPLSTRPPARAITIKSKSVQIEWTELIDHKVRGKVQRWQLQRTVPVCIGASQSYDWRTAKWETVAEHIHFGETSFTVRDLEPSTRYYFRVRPFLHTRDEYLPWEECAVSEAILTLAAPPEEPKPPTVRDVTYSSITIEWEAPRDNGNPIEQFGLRLCQVETSNKWKLVSQEINDSTRTLEIKNLKPGTKYIFAVRARNSIGWSTYSGATIPIKTRTSPPPSAPTLIHRTDSWMEIQWSIPFDRSEIISYDVQISSACSPNDFRDIPPNLITDTSAVIPDLKPVSGYLFRVRGKTRDGHSTNFSPVAGPFKTKRKF